VWNGHKRGGFLLALLMITSSAAAATNVFGPKTYTLTTGAPASSSDVIPFDPSQSCDGKAVYLLRIDNGGGVSSAVVTFNGATIAGDSDFSSTPMTLERAVTMIPGSNALAVTLKGGKPGSGLTITLRKQIEDAVQSPSTFTLLSAQQTFSASIAVSNASGPFVLAVTNGDAAALHRVDSGSVSFNGVEVISAHALTRNAGLIRVPVAVQANNTVMLSLKGKAGSFVSLTLKRVLDDSACGVSVAISAPAAGATVTTRTLVVTGTASGGQDIAVTVNGFSAVVDLNHAGTLVDPLQWAAVLTPNAGPVHLAAAAANQAGASAHAERDVLFAPASEGLALLPSVKGGTEPLSVTFLIDPVVQSPVTLYEADLDGDGTYEIQSATPPGSLLQTYNRAGTYAPGARITLADGRQFTTTTPIVVQSFQTVDTQLRALWASVVDGLRRGDVPAVLALMTKSAQDRYGSRLAGIQTALPGVAGSIHDVLTVSIGARTAHYLITRDENGQVMGHHIYFVRDPQGIWRLEQF
jgi:hypothetical protein